MKVSSQEVHHVQLANIYCMLVRFHWIGCFWSGRNVPDSQGQVPNKL